MPWSILAYSLGIVSPSVFGTSLLDLYVRKKAGPSLRGMRAEPFQRTYKRYSSMSAEEPAEDVLGGDRCREREVATARG